MWPAEEWDDILYLRHFPCFVIKRMTRGRQAWPQRVCQYSVRVVVSFWRNSINNFLLLIPKFIYKNPNMIYAHKTYDTESPRHIAMFCFYLDPYQVPLRWAAMGKVAESLKVGVVCAWSSTNCGHQVISSHLTIYCTIPYKTVITTPKHTDTRYAVKMSWFMVIRRGWVI